MTVQKFGLRERTRRAVQSELLQVAMELFLIQGYDDTTVAQIAEAANMSTRSFFRYFASKDDLLSQGLANTGRELATALRDRPAPEAPWTALRRAFDPLILQMTTSAQVLAMTRMMLESPTMSASHIHKQASWQADIATVLTTRLPDAGPDRSMQAETLSGAALACLTVAQRHWVAQNGQQPLDRLLDLAMQAVRPLD